MGDLPLTLVMKDYDYIYPLVYGDVVIEGIKLNLQRDTPDSLARSLNDSSVHIGEFSLSRHLIRMAEGDDSIVGIPFFAGRGFAEHHFFVRRESGLHELRQLEGKRIGTNEWPATGNTWARIAMREQGVSLDRIQWWVGPMDNPDASSRPQGSLPPDAQLTAPGGTLRDMLLAGKLGAMICQLPPKGYYEANGPSIHLISDFRRAGQDYFRRTCIYPGHHVVGIRREVFNANPWVARSIYRALEKSKTLWEERRWCIHETTPWILADIEEAVALLGHDWQPNGVEPNRKMIQVLCEEEYTQGLIKRPLDWTTVFAEFEKIMKGS